MIPEKVEKLLRSRNREDKKIALEIYKAMNPSDPSMEFMNLIRYMPSSLVDEYFDRHRNHEEGVLVAEVVKIKYTWKK